ncbi:hypothetical protein [Budvicia diplopodorum]|uniref:hypothetical protein n=1 Tax=Budvicia diplopodorum TaxID=1119056 RepID=UPI0013578BB7|nr:hypothetical protein [Budvicia diplopodorum]
MKIRILLALFVGLLFSVNAQAKFAISFGEVESVKVVAELPDTEDFTVKKTSQSSVKQYLDVGILYSSFEVLYIPVWTTKDPILVLANKDNKDSYYSVNSIEMDKILTDNKLDKSELLNPGFFVKFGGKLILIGLILLFILYSCRSKKED